MNCIFLRRGYGTSGDGVNYVEWIKTSGTQYFNTNYVPDAKTRIVFDIKWGGSVSSYLFGTRNTASGGDSYSNSLFITSASKPRYDYYGSSVTDTITFPTTRITVERNANVTTINGTSKTHTSSTSKSQYPLFLFAVNTAGTVSNIGAFECYENGVQIYDDGVTLTHDYRPAIDPNGVACLYDKVTKTYLYMSGSGTIEAGSSISGGGTPTPSEYTVTLKGTMSAVYAYATIDGTKYSKASTITVTAGTSISVYVQDLNNAGTSYVKLNGTTVKTGSGTYTFAPSSNVTLTFGQNSSTYSYHCDITTS